jgi:hypothetical protein
METRKRIGAVAVAAVLALALAGGILAAGSGRNPEELDKLRAKDQKISVEFHEGRLDRLFATLRRVGAVQKVRMADEVAGKRVTIDVTSQTVREVLARIADEYGLAYEVPDPETLVVKASEEEPEPRDPA